LINWQVIREANNYIFKDELLVASLFAHKKSAIFSLIIISFSFFVFAYRALEHIRRKRPIRINSGFLQQIADLDNQMDCHRSQNHFRSNSEQIDN
jgi:hypothetical protein